jgi:hypothetical protein
MEININSVSEKYVGCLCLLKWSTVDSGFTGHSLTHGLERGQVANNFLLVGRLCQVTNEGLCFLTAVTAVRAGFGRRYWSLEEHDIQGVTFEELRESTVFINPTENSNSIQQYLKAQDRKWSSSTWERVAPYWHEL